MKLPLGNVNTVRIRYIAYSLRGKLLDSFRAIEQFIDISQSAVNLAKKNLFTVYYCYQQLLIRMYVHAGVDILMLVVEIA